MKIAFGDFRRRKERLQVRRSRTHAAPPKFLKLLIRQAYSLPQGGGVLHLISLQEYSFRYANQAEGQTAINGINLKINDGEIVVLCGQSGSGKSTLLRCMKKEITPAGESFGNIEISLKPWEVAIVFQDPNTQLVNQTVQEDLVFHMENLGYSKQTMHKRLAETVSFFGLEGILNKPITELSGGQKQMVALCAALMTRPKLLLLDEPVSQLDPIAARELWDVVARIHDETGIAIVVAEHKLDDVAALAHRIVFMRNGSIKHSGKTDEAFRAMHKDDDVSGFIPDIARFGLAIGVNQICFTPGQARREIAAKDIKTEDTEIDNNTAKLPTQISIKNIFYTYNKSDDFVLKNLSLNIYKGDKLCLFGGNGAGKSTLLRAVGGAFKPQSGRIKKHGGKVCFIPQNIRSFFRFDTVEKELEFSAGSEINSYWVKFFGIEKLLNNHPLDLSGGEAQKVALACVLSTGAGIILMDEPTKGMDAYAKAKLAEALKSLNVTIVIATHDMIFAAYFANRCAMLFNGQVSFEANPSEFFSQNHYYTTPINLALRHISPSVITFEEARKLWA